MNYQIVVGNKKFEVSVAEVGSGVARVVVNGESYDVTIENYAEVTGSAVQGVAGRAPAGPAEREQVSPAPAATPQTRPAAGAGTPVLAPMPGVIVSLKVKVGDKVAENQTVVTVEAMKMENNIAATSGGTVKQILVSPGDHLSTGDVILVIG